MLDSTTQAVTPVDDLSMVIPADTLRAIGRGSRKDGRRRVKTWIDLQRNLHPISGPTEKPDNVRVAVQRDEEALLRLMMLDVQENAASISEPSPDRVLHHIRDATRRRGSINGVIDGPDGTPVASVHLAPFQPWYSNAFSLQEVWNFVHPAYRASKYADSLMKFARWCSDDMSTNFGYRVYLYQGVTTKDDVWPKVAYYSRHSNFMGAFFIYPDVGGNGR